LRSARTPLQTATFSPLLTHLCSLAHVAKALHQDWNTQHILVTGAASGLGRAICRRFAELGATVHGIDINKDSLEEMRGVLGEHFFSVICDVTNWEEVIRAFDRFPPIDVLVNSAGNNWIDFSEK
jgi:NAD(P)-dependent dehydrogenase (short-subunit alcohol dehydrogenase family)